MNYFKLPTIFIFSILISYSAISQDTIFFKSKEKLVAIVKEISQTEIQYKKIELPDGPMYVVEKKLIDKIVYKNGYSEKIDASAPSVATKQESQPTVIQNENKVAQKEIITYETACKRYYYLSFLVNSHPDVNKRPMLLTSAKSIRNLRMGQDATRTVSIIFGALTIATGAIYGIISNINANNGTNAGSNFVVVPVAFGSLGVALAGTSIGFHVGLKKKRHQFVKAYNE